MNRKKLLLVFLGAVAFHAMELATSSLPPRTAFFYFVSGVAATMAAYLMDPRTPAKRRR